MARRPAKIAETDFAIGDSLMDIDIKTLLSVKHFIRLIKDKYEIGGVVLFGSRARGTHGDDSDVDLAIIVKGPPGDFVATKLDMASHAYDSMLETDVSFYSLTICVSELREL